MGPQLRPAGLSRGTSQYSTLSSIMTKAVVLVAIFATVAQGLVDIEWKFYPKPQRKCAEVGEEVTFNWGGSGHNVVKVNSKKDFDDCTGFVEWTRGKTDLSLSLLTRRANTISSAAWEVIASTATKRLR